MEKGSVFDDALDDKEFEGNLIYLFRSASDFIKNNSKVRFYKDVSAPPPPAHIAPPGRGARR